MRNGTKAFWLSIVQETLIFPIYLFFFNLSSQKQHIQMQNCFTFSFSSAGTQYKARFGTQFSGETYTIQPRPFHPVCTAWVQGFANSHEAATSHGNCFSLEPRVKHTETT